MFNFSPFQNSKFRLPALSRTAFFFDFDGDLIPLSSNEKAVPLHAADHCDLVLRLQKLCGDAVAVLSQFPINQVEQYIPKEVFAVIGENGDVIRPRPGDEIEKADVPQIPPYLMSHIRKTIAHMEGVFLEHIEGGILLRYIAAPEHAQELYDLAQGWIKATKGQFHLTAAPMAWCISPVGINRGSAIMRVMEDAPFKGRIPVFVGQNFGNEDAIEAIHDLNGMVLRLPTDFPTPATFWSWLDSLVESHERQQ